MRVNQLSSPLLKCMAWSAEWQFPPPLHPNTWWCNTLACRCRLNIPGGWARGSRHQTPPPRHTKTQTPQVIYMFYFTVLSHVTNSTNLQSTFSVAACRKVMDGVGWGRGGVEHTVDTPFSHMPNKIHPSSHTRKKTKTHPWFLKHQNAHHLDQSLSQILLCIQNL